MRRLSRRLSYWTATRGRRNSPAHGRSTYDDQTRSDRVLRYENPSRSRLEIVAQLFVQRLGQCHGGFDAKIPFNSNCWIGIRQSEAQYQDDIDLLT